MLVAVIAVIVIVIGLAGGVYTGDVVWVIEAAEIVDVAVHVIELYEQTSGSLERSTMP